MFQYVILLMRLLISSCDLMCVGAAVPVALVSSSRYARPLGRFRLQPMSDSLTAMRHCSMELFSTAAAKADHPDDFTFDLTYANYDKDLSIRCELPDHYVQVVNGLASSTIASGSLQPKNRTKASRELASFKVVGGLGTRPRCPFFRRDGRVHCAEQQAGWGAARTHGHHGVGHHLAGKTDAGGRNVEIASATYVKKYAFRHPLCQQRPRRVHFSY